MNYNKFAYVYDYLMQDAPYDEWIKFTESMMERYNMDVTNIIDLGCGTGNITIPLGIRGYHVIGVDLSDEMLSIAYNKMLESRLQFPLFKQNMMELELDSKAELIISYCDSLNYLENEAEVRKTFEKVSQHLIDGGYFIFDMHSPNKIKYFYDEKSLTINDDEISVIWETDVDEDALSIQHDLTFFVETDEGYYEKFHEIHRQRTYHTEKVKEFLKATGLTLIDTYGDFRLEGPNENTERIFYVAKK